MHLTYMLTYAAPTQCMLCYDSYNPLSTLRTLPNWYAEFQRFTPDIPVILYHGTPEERAQKRTRINRKSGKGLGYGLPVVITSYVTNSLRLTSVLVSSRTLMVVLRAPYTGGRSNTSMSPLESVARFLCHFMLTCSIPMTSSHSSDTR